MTTSTKQKPTATLRDGAIKATIWANSNEKGDTFYNVTFSRTYRDGDTFKDTSSFGSKDLLRVARLATKAYDSIVTLRTSSQGDDTAEE